MPVGVGKQKNGGSGSRAEDAECTRKDVHGMSIGFLIAQAMHSEMRMWA